MNHREAQCLDCGSRLPEAARFCPQCGVPSEVPYATGPNAVRDTKVTTVGFSTEGPRRIAIAAALIGALLLGWSIIGRALTDSGDSTDSPTTAASTEPPTATPAIATPSTELPAAGTSATAIPADAVTSPGGGVTSTAALPEPIYVNDVAGPVLGEGVEGALFGVSIGRLSKIDLATGEISFIRLNFPGEGTPGPGSDVLRVFDGALVQTVDITTGNSSGFVRLGQTGSRIAGRGGPNSVWVVSQTRPESDTTASEVDLNGDVLRTIDLRYPIEVVSAMGDILYLRGGDESFRLDTMPSTATPLAGRLIDTASDAIVTLACEPTLECSVSIDTGGGPAPTSALTVADVEGVVRVSPDLTEALVRQVGFSPTGLDSLEIPGIDFLEGGVELTSVDLTTSERIDLAEIYIELHGPMVWIPNTAWVIGVTGRDLTAVNTVTAEVRELDLLGRLGFAQNLTYRSHPTK